MNIFAGLQTYATGYNVKSSRSFTAEEISLVNIAKVCLSQYGMSVCFYMKAGGQKYIPVSRDSVCNIGDVVDLTKAKILILDREGSDDITRIEI